MIDPVKVTRVFDEDGVLESITFKSASISSILTRLAIFYEAMGPELFREEISHKVTRKGKHKVTIS